MAQADMRFQSRSKDNLDSMVRYLSRRDGFDAKKLLYLYEAVRSGAISDFKPWPETRPLPPKVGRIGVAGKRS